MKPKSIIISGTFTEEDWKELLQAVRQIEQRHPETDYKAVIHDKDASMEEALHMVKNTFPYKEGGEKPDLYVADNSDIRKMQLVAREGVLSEILEECFFPTENHKKVIQLLYDEVVKEMHDLGLEEC